jgi:hypothetical protein
LGALTDTNSEIGFSPPFLSISVDDVFQREHTISGDERISGVV